MSMNCDKCIRSSVCIYEESARRDEEKVNEITKDSFISVTVNCPKFIFKYDNKGKKNKTVKEATV